MGHGRKKKRTHAVPSQEEIEKIPKTLVVKSGSVGRSVGALVSDVRHVMEPNTASKLKERKTNKIKDYIAVSSQLGLTHLMLFSQTEAGTNLRIGRIPRGPTLYFRVNKYSLAKDCLKLQRTPHVSDAEYKTSPLIILNNFAGEEKGKELKLMTAMLQNMFPAINPSTMHLSDARRVVLFNYNEATGMVDFRHFTIVVKPVGVTKGVKRVIMAKNLPSLAGYDDISEYVLREAFASESDVEDGPENSVTLPQDYVGRGNTKNEQRAIRLLELGPRMELRLMKIEGGLCEGEILYHNYLHKTKSQLEKEARMRQIKLTRQARRRQEQEQNVERKKKVKSKKVNTARNEKTSDDDKNDDDDEYDSMSEADSDMAPNDNSDVESEAKIVLPKSTRPRASADDFGADEYKESDDEDEGARDAEMDDDEEDYAEEERKPAKRSKTSKSVAPKKVKPTKSKFASSKPAKSSKPSNKRK
ncbi:rRNA-binding ribosome biosynthesis protein [Coemansia aciculifera]|uniref:rRNA-binding ribosome biosynthesis protein n=1 Tax=Coemansia aciculifera TaxID=417176 RepID=A0A9W8M274_9FUNG|nr:rRNA-binding ribosome biosynthesis protein [Coemansia aciculifera]KAJ2868758.1 rRNA-binding ribosome biosynthesis protein [Coemansia aciculifera]KAJ2879038.1 rRNA-binding ribosome biosynthesis protein [Coemansia aciculifera]